MPVTDDADGAGAWLAVGASGEIDPSRLGKLPPRRHGGSRAALSRANAGYARAARHGGSGGAEGGCAVPASGAVRAAPAGARATISTFRTPCHPGSTAMDTDRPEPPLSPSIWPRRPHAGVAGGCARPAGAQRWGPAEPAVVGGCVTWPWPKMKNKMRCIPHTCCGPSTRGRRPAQLSAEHWAGLRWAAAHHCGLATREHSPSGAARVDSRKLGFRALCTRGWARRGPRPHLVAPYLSQRPASHCAPHHPHHYPHPGPATAPPCSTMKVLAILYRGGQAAKNQPKMLGAMENELGLRQWLESRGHTLVVTDDKEGPNSVFAKEVVDADVLITTPFHPGYLTRSLMDTAKNLKIAITAGVGSDHIDLTAANERKIDVIEVTGALPLLNPASKGCVWEGRCADP